MIILWFLPLFVILHIVDEFVFPGGFMAWYRNYKSSVSSSFTVRYIVIINCVLVILCILPLVLGETLQSFVLWLSMASVIFFNALFHIRGNIKLGKYSPGIITSVLLYIPISMYGYWFFLSNHLVPIELAAQSSLIGLLYLWFSTFNHRRRSKKIESTNK